ncbi:MAG TPA: D-cysteine desulfhydrase family protein [Methylomirabilota bacterium]|nr:D-cysteine desulfhydrase family protein [Methylomirabilota bacterium]
MAAPESFPRVSLGFFPTPVEPLPRVGAELGVELWIKRDDYTGFGGGGNKVRKLEFLMAEAQAAGAEVLITTGGHQSNHARMVAAAACRFGMRAVLVLRGNPPQEWQGNLLLDRLFGAEFEFLPPDEYFRLIDDRMAAQAERARAAGLRPYVIPLGGASALGALGYVLAMQELAEQFRALGVERPDVLVTPVGSGGTQAGLEVGIRRWWPGTRVVGISVSRDRAFFQERISQFATACAELLGWGFGFSPGDIWIEDGYVGPGYGVPSEGSIAAIREAARREGILLDPVYTGKAMDGLKGLVRTGAVRRGQRVLFLHCGGGPSLYPFARALAGA